jgi:hypothetical protein
MNTDEKLQGILSIIKKRILSHDLQFHGHKKLGEFRNYKIKVYKANGENYFTIALNTIQNYMEISYHQSLDILSIETKSYSPEDFTTIYQYTFISDLYGFLTDESFIKRILELKSDD